MSINRWRWNSSLLQGFTPCSTNYRFTSWLNDWFGIKNLLNRAAKSPRLRRRAEQHSSSSRTQRSKERSEHDGCSGGRKGGQNNSRSIQERRHHWYEGFFHTIFIHDYLGRCIGNVERLFWWSDLGINATKDIWLNGRQRSSRVRIMYRKLERRHHQCVPGFVTIMMPMSYWPLLLLIFILMLMNLYTIVWLSSQKPTNVFVIAVASNHLWPSLKLRWRINQIIKPISKEN